MVALIHLYLRLRLQNEDRTLMADNTSTGTRKNITNRWRDFDCIVNFVVEDEPIYMIVEFNDTPSQLRQDKARLTTGNANHVLPSVELLIRGNEVLIDEAVDSFSRTVALKHFERQASLSLLHLFDLLLLPLVNLYLVQNIVTLGRGYSDRNVHL